MKRENILVTPEIARSFLDRRHNLRRESPSLVTKYARAMSLGEWIPEHPDPIAFDISGRLRNVHQQLKLAVELHEAAPKLSWSKAFAQAATMMPNRPKR